MNTKHVFLIVWFLLILSSTASANNDDDALSPAVNRPAKVRVAPSPDQKPEVRASEQNNNDTPAEKAVAQKAATPTKVNASEANDAVGGESGEMGRSLQTLAKRLDEQLREKKLEALSVAVMAFAEFGARSKEKKLGYVVQSELNTAFHEKGYRLIERQRLIDILKEEETAQLLGAVDDKSAGRIAEMVGADLLVVGSVGEVGARFLVNARVVSAQSAVAVAAAKEEVPSSYLIALSNEAVVLKTKWGATYRSMLLPGWGQFYNEQPVKGGLFAGFQLLTIGAVLGLHFGARAAHDDYKSYRGDQDTMNEKYELAENLLLARNVMFGAIALVWTVNVIDAAVSGKTFARAKDKSIKLKNAEITVSPSIFQAQSNTPLIPGGEIGVVF